MIETHCHLNDSDAFPDVEAAIARAKNARVKRLIVVGIEPASWKRALEIADRFEEVYATVGWHPNYTASFRDTNDLRQALAHPKVVALGEIGLDFHWDYASVEEQHRALFAQLDLAEELGCNVVFHCREAYGPLLDVLERRTRLPYLFHCWAGNSEEATRAVALGCYFGVDGPITYKKSDNLREVVASLPRDRIVLETDSPYLTPAPFRGKPNEPAYLPFVNEGLAKALGIPPEEAARITTENAMRFFWRRK